MKIVNGWLHTTNQRITTDAKRFPLTLDHELLSFATRDEWRAWLRANHDRAADAWLILGKKGRGTVTLSFEEVQIEALCFGWTDVKSKRIDAAHYQLRFTPRRANSVWSLTNIRRAEVAIADGRMTDVGLAKIAEAQHNGQWEAGIKSEQTDHIPADLAQALRQSKGALSRYRKLSHSRKKQLLHKLYTPTSEATRQRRIAAIVQEVSA
jgi:uncharacterized protein YdeI (YjbR/CyaY-like superfamily)